MKRITAICLFRWRGLSKYAAKYMDALRGTMLISTIRCINQAVSDCMTTMAKMVEPPIGILNTALFGDDVVDTSEKGLTVFNALN